MEAWLQEQVRKEREERKKTSKYVNPLEAKLRELLKEPNFNPKRAELLTCGFIHEWNKQNIKTNCIIPEELILTFCKFHAINDITWNTQFIGHGIEFTKNDKMATFKPWTVKRFWGRLASLFVNKIISNKMCKKFEIKYIVNGGLSKCGFGYIPTIAFDKFNPRQALGNDNQQLGEDKSVGLYLDGQTTKLKVVTGHGFGNVKLDAKSLSNLSTRLLTGGIIGLLFDFENDQLEIYHNDTFVNKLCLEGHKKFNPCIDFWW